MQYQVKQGKKDAVPLRLMQGLLVSWGLSVLFSAVTAALVLGGRVGEGAVSTAAVLTLLVASFVGASLTAAKTEKRRMVICLAEGGIYYLSLLGCNALLFGGSYQGTVPAFLTVLGSVLLAGFLNLKRKSPKYKVKKWSR